MEPSYVSNPVATGSMIRIPSAAPSQFVVVAALVGLLGCADERRLSRLPCELPEVAAIPSEDTVLIAGEPTCRLEFREVLRFEGSADGPLPRPPIAVRPGGGYVTATYDPGHLALWSADGEVERVIGRGPGSGPGEFSHANHVTLSRDTIVVFDPKGGVHRYRSTGEFIDYLRGEPGAGGVMPDGTPIISVSDGEGFVLLEPGGLRPFGPPRPVLPHGATVWHATFTVVADRVWEAEDYVYEIRHYPVEDPSSIRMLRREVPWFPLPDLRGVMDGFSPNRLREIVVGPSGLIWTGLTVADLDGPSLPEAESEQPAPIDQDDWSEYVDGRIEAFMPDGTLIASEVFDDPLETPRPINARRWYLTEDDVYRSLVILEPRLGGVSRQDDGPR